jgi:nitrogen-specific signal transduction histidine kinase
VTAVNDPWQDWMPPHPHWDAVLRLVPSHVFIFDATLVCRYAAPAGEAFLGQSRESLLGRHAAEILPPAANGLRPILERAAQEAARWSTPHYRYSQRVADEETVHIWAVQVEPLVMTDHSGVLLTLYDVLDLVEERDQLQLERSALEVQLQQVHALVQERERELRASGAHLRTLLTSVWGYLQLLARRPQGLGERSTTATIDDLVMPQLREIIQTVNDFEHGVDVGPDKP